MATCCIHCGVEEGELHASDCPALRSAFEHIERERDRALAEIERLRKDAERYRWLRSHGLDRSNGFYHISWYQQYDDDYPCSNDEIDAAIDAAMREGE